MKSILLFIISIPVMLLSVHCKVKSKTGKGYEKIVFGSGGGFTGQVKSYSLDTQGIVILEKDNKKIDSISSKKLKEIYKKLDKAHGMDIDFQKPGNFYYFLELSKEGKTNRIIWSDQNKAPDEITSVYRELTTLIHSEK